MAPRSSRYMFKVTIIGDYAVGKTSLIRRYMTNTFEESYKATLGAAISNFKTAVADSTISLQVWDLAGQTAFQRIRVQYLFGTDFAIVVYDITRKDTLDCVKDWVKDVRQSAPKVLLYLVGNKTDLEENRVVSSSSAKQIGKSLNMLGYLETSAKDGSNVRKLFQNISQLLYDHTQKNS